MRRVQIAGTIGAVLALEVLYVYGYERIEIIYEKLFQTAINFDIVYFIMAILGAVLFTLLFHAFFRKVMKINSGVVLESRKRELLFEGITYCIIAYTHVKAFFNETEVFDAESFYMPWHTEPIYEWFVIALAGVCIFEARKIVKCKLCEYQNVSLKVWYLFLAAVASYSLYQPNCFLSFYNVHHTDAYFNSVYRVLHLQPYSEVNTGVYGFYGIILAPITKLLGGGIEHVFLH